MSKEKILTIDDLPMHKDTYFFGYGINIDKPYEMANQIIKLKKENQELNEQLEEMDSKLFFTKNELEMRQKSIDNKLRQQKEFIEWLEKEIQGQEDYAVSLGLTIDYGIAEYTSGKIDALKESLSKYKEIKGVKND